MKKKNIVLIVIVLLLLGGLLWWNLPSHITSIKPEKVSKIEIFDGGTGKSTSITEQKDIEHIIQNLNSVTVNKKGISLFYLGYSFRTTIYKTNGKVYKKFILNSGDTLRKDPFFYQSKSGNIDYDYIKGLVRSK